MPNEIKVLDCDPSSLEATLNKPASQGWHLVSCWPEGQRVRAVFQRATPAAAKSPASQAAAPAPAATPPPAKRAATTAAALPTGTALLDAVLAACQAAPAKLGSNGKPLPPGVSLDQLAKTWGVTPEALRKKLDALGVKEKSSDPTGRDHQHAGYYVWFYKNYVNTRPAKRKSPPRP